MNKPLQIEPIEPTYTPEKFEQDVVSAVRFTTNQIELIKRQIMPKDASDDELRLFLYQCARTGLDPFHRQINAIRRGQKLSIEVSVDGFRLLSERSGKYAGMLGPLWCGEDGEWRDVWLHPDKPPVAAKVGILRSDFKQPVWATALYDEYKVSTNRMWDEMPSNQLAIVAEKKARRIAFPYELGGLYGSEEMEQAGGPIAPTKPMWPGEAVAQEQDLTQTLEASIAEVRNSKPLTHVNETEACGCGSPLIWKVTRKNGVSQGHWFCRLNDLASGYHWKTGKGRSTTEEERGAAELVRKLHDSGEFPEQNHTKFKSKKPRGEE